MMLHFSHSSMKDTLTLKAAMTTAADGKICASIPNFSEKNKVGYFMRIVCKQTILMNYHALFDIFVKISKI